MSWDRCLAESLHLVLFERNLKSDKYNIDKEMLVNSDIELKEKIYL